MHQKATKANKSQFVSPGTKKARRQTKDPSSKRERERESNGNALNNVDICVLLEELETVGDDNEVALLPKSREELVAELE
jgi:hypothetical protein